MLEQLEQPEPDPPFATPSRTFLVSRWSKHRVYDESQKAAISVMQSLASWSSTDDKKAPLGTPHKQDKRRDYVLPMALQP